AGKNENGNDYLCAYMVCRNKIELADIRGFLGKQLPDYMIPAYFVNIEKIPLTANGKIDRRALPDPIKNSLADNSDYMPPQNEIEKLLVDVWEKVLGREKVGINQNFFAVGGDSIKSLQIISKMSSAGYQLEMKDLFQYPVISKLVPYVKKRKRVPVQSAITGTVSLTPIQEAFFNESHPMPHHYNQAVMFYSRERFDREAVKNVFAKIQEHHDALRMTYQKDGNSGAVTQMNHGLEYPLYIEEHDLRDCENCFGVLKTKADRIQASIDLEKGPLMKFGLFRLNDGDRLLIVIHHLVVDGVSWRILFEDIETMYQQYKQGEKLALPPKTDSFKLWSEKLTAYALSKTFLKEKNYWQEIETAAARVPTLPADFNIDNNNIEDAASVSFTLQENETESLLTKVNEAFGTEINDILLTALGMGIKKTFKQDQVSIALEGHGREDVLAEIDISRTVGWFTALYPVLLDVSHADDPGRQIKEIKETLRRIPNKGIGYGILKYMTGKGNKGTNEFKLKPPIRFNYWGQFDNEIKQISSFETAQEPVGNLRGPGNKREYLLDISGINANSRLTMTISYNKTHYQPGTITELAKNFESELKYLIGFCMARENSERGPVDFTYKGLSFARIDRLMMEYPELEDIYTLSPMQEGMLFHALVDDSSSYFEQISYRLQGELDISLVKKSLHELFKRHDILRTVFVNRDIERPVQVVLKSRAVDLYYDDIRKITEPGKKENFIKKFKAKDKKRLFDLSNDVLLRISILRTAESEYEFTWSFHHILMDGWCIGILNNEFFEIYNSYFENRPYELPAVKPYRDYIQWLEKLDKEESRRYWQNYFDSYEGQTGLPIPITKAPKGKNVYKNDTVSVVLDKEKTARLHKRGAECQVTLNTLIQALWGILLGKYNGREDVVFGAVVSGRPAELAGVESMIGLFINTIPVRVRFEGKMKLDELFRQIQQEALAGELYHYHSLAEIQSQIVLRQNLVDHILVFENYPVAEQIEGYGGEKKKNNQTSFKLTDIDVFEQTNYNFNVLISGSEQLNISFKYNGNVYGKDFVKRIAGHFMFAIDQASENHESEIRDFTFLPEKEKHRLLYKLNNIAVDYPRGKTIHELFAEQAEKSPDRIAITGPVQPVQPDQHVQPFNLTYRRLNEQSDRLASELIKKGVR
ncbi:MAG TPA: condensation domain-containing protein, partial [Candidatus Deferrimicrobium sp.]|nr:condensation domain-containing protein [Candidatus Deferrimicrobium sp.]